MTYYYCPGHTWKCPVKNKCCHYVKIPENKDSFITPKYVGKNGCVYFKEVENGK